MYKYRIIVYSYFWSSWVGGGFYHAHEEALALERHREYGGQLYEGQFTGWEKPDRPSGKLLKWLYSSPTG